MIARMSPKERLHAAMRRRLPDRVPVMCQLALGHYFLNSTEDAFAIWYTSGGFARALVELARRYRFDGILINLPGRDHKIEEYLNYIRYLGKAGIPYSTYAHMGNGIWSSGPTAHTV